MRLRASAILLRYVTHGWQGGVNGSLLRAASRYEAASLGGTATLRPVRLARRDERLFVAHGVEE